MATAHPLVAQAGNFTAPANTEHGVLQVLRASFRGAASCSRSSSAMRSRPVATFNAIWRSVEPAVGIEQPSHALVAPCADTGFKDLQLRKLCDELSLDAGDFRWFMQLHIERQVRFPCRGCAQS